MTDSSHPIAAARRNLQRLNLIRCIVLGGQFLALYYFTVQRDIGLPASFLGGVLVLYTAVLGASVWRAHWRVPITRGEFLGHLLVDVLFFTALLYYSGGASNPFVSYYLVPVCIAAATLPRRVSWLIAALSLLAYSALMRYHYPVEVLAPGHGAHAGHDMAAAGNLHLLGMWANFAISAGLITWFVARMAAELRQQEAETNRLREEELRQDQVLAVATLAAGTAHELGTPLNTMQLLLEELLAAEHDTDTDADLQTLQQQLQQCRQILSRLVQTAREGSGEEAPAQNVRDWFDDLLQGWLVLRPDARPQVSIDPRSPDIEARLAPTVAQSLRNLLDNAADASADIEVQVRWDRRQAQIEIRDRGPGIDPALLDSLGEAVVTSKPDGLGLGLLLSRSALHRAGGEVVLENRPGGGTLTRVSLRLSPAREV